MEKKKILFKHIGTVITFSIFIWLAFGSGDNGGGGSNQTYSPPPCYQCIYDQHIVNADNYLSEALTIEDYERARREYQNALDVHGFSNEGYPRRQIIELDKIIKELYEKNYKDLIQSAENYFRNNDYLNAYSYYKQALAISQTEENRQHVIESLNELYNSAVIKGDNLKYEKALAMYELALNISNLLDNSVNESQIQSKIESTKIAIVKKQKRDKVLHIVIQIILVIVFVLMIIVIILNITLWDNRDILFKVINGVAGLFGIIAYLLFDTFDLSICIAIRDTIRQEEGITIAIVAGFIPFIISLSSTLFFVKVFATRDNLIGERIIMITAFFMLSFYADIYINANVEEGISYLLPALAIAGGFISYSLGYGSQKQKNTTK